MGTKFAVEAIWPASERQIQRKRPAEVYPYRIPEYKFKHAELR